MKVLSFKIHLKNQAFKNIFKIESGIMRVFLIIYEYSHYNESISIILIPSINMLFIFIIYSIIYII